MNKSESKYFNTALRMDEALIALLEKKDLEYITVKEICEKAGVNRSTFYLHYESIADLVNEAMESVNERFLSYFTKKSFNNPLFFPIEFSYSYIIIYLLFFNIL